MTELIRGRVRVLIQACVIQVQPNHHTVTRLHLVILSIQTRDFSVSVFGIGINSHLCHSEISHSIRKTELNLLQNAKQREASMDLCLLRGVRKLSDSLGSLCWASSSKLNLRGFWVYMSLQTLPKTSLYCLHQKCSISHNLLSSYKPNISLSCSLNSYLISMFCLRNRNFWNSKVRACCAGAFIHMD